jgi:hypothetical protein
MPSPGRRKAQPHPTLFSPAQASAGKGKAEENYRLPSVARQMEVFRSGGWVGEGPCTILILNLISPTHLLQIHSEYLCMGVADPPIWLCVDIFVR